MSITSLPFFVYGTLRNGQDNYPRHLAGHTENEAAGIVANYRMIGYDDGFPFALDGGPGDTITGEVMWIKPESYETVLASMDHLEGYKPTRQNRRKNLYNREVVTVLLADGSSVQAWMYVSTYDYDYLIARGIPAIPSGDWLAQGQDD